MTADATLGSVFLLFLKDANALLGGKKLKPGIKPD